MNKQELLAYIRDEVEYQKSLILQMHYYTSKIHARGAIEAYVDIYKKLLAGDIEISDSDRAWANDVLNNLFI